MSTTADDIDPPASDRRRKGWCDLPPQARKGVIVLGVIELVLTTVAVRDLVRRPASTVRGWKPLWFLAVFVQPVGPPTYLCFGRRRAK